MGVPLKEITIFDCVRSTNNILFNCILLQNNCSKLLLIQIQSVANNLTYRKEKIIIYFYTTIKISFSLKKKKNTYKNQHPSIIYINVCIWIILHF